MSTCADCRFFAPHVLGSGTFVGQCRHSAPPALAMQVDDGRRTIKIHAFWPLVDGTDWCGDFQQAPTNDPEAIVESLSKETGALNLVDLPDGQLRTCRSCEAQILFAPTKPSRQKPEGSRMPLTWPHNPLGNVVWNPDGDEPVSVYRNGEAVPPETPSEHRWHSHFIDCPGAQGHRRKR